MRGRRVDGWIGRVNFLSHALPYFDRPVVAVCTGVPDWLSVIDRKIRARRRQAATMMDADDAIMRDVAAGILAHIDDDRWFHGGETFTRMNLEFAVALRDRLPGDEGFRPSFVGHILIEMLIDAAYVADHRSLVDDYYALVRSSDGDAIQHCINAITGKPSDAIASTIRRFADVGFLYDYATDAGLLFRVNQVLGRVGLPTIAEPDVIDWLADARAQVRENYERLLAPAGRTLLHPRLL